MDERKREQTLDAGTRNERARRFAQNPTRTRLLFSDEFNPRGAGRACDRPAP